MAVKKFLMIALYLICFSGASRVFAAQLSYGKYFGTIQMNGRPEVIAVSLDAFITQITDPTVYPALTVVVRANLGGYQSSEYIGYYFYDPTFNFEKSILQLSDPKNDLSATLQVTNTDSQTILEGPVTYRPTNSQGTLRVVMNLDDQASLKLQKDQAPFLSTLKGEYFGKCGSDLADLQIETGRGLGDNTPGNTFTGYTITGRLGFTNGPLCGRGNGKYCGLYTFSSGTYSPFSNKLTMQGPLGTIECTRANDDLTCLARGYDKGGNCQLAKKSSSATAPVQIPAGIFLDVPSQQKSPLPDPLPPGNDDLLAALNGDFYGFLHYENRDTYQLLEMSVNATTSTENPHVPNQVMIAPTVSLRLGSSWDSTPIFSALFEQRVFYMNQGFALQSGDNDNFVVIGNWRKGYLSGVWYSRSYGRVGTFEMMKGTRPSVPANMAVIPNPIGQFQGPLDAPAPGKNLYSVEIEAPNQASGSQQGAVSLVGRYRGPGMSSLFDASAIDLNTGSLSFLLKEETGKGSRLITGEMISDKTIKLQWPAGPALGAPMTGYGEFTYSSAGM